MSPNHNARKLRIVDIVGLIFKNKYKNNKKSIKVVSIILKFTTFQNLHNGPK